MTGKMRNAAITSVKETEGKAIIGKGFIYAHLLVGIISALLYIGDVLKDGFKKLEKKS